MPFLYHELHIATTWDLWNVDSIIYTFLKKPILYHVDKEPYLLHLCLMLPIRGLCEDGIEVTLATNMDCVTCCNLLAWQQFFSFWVPLMLHIVFPSSSLLIGDNWGLATWYLCLVHLTNNHIPNLFTPIKKWWHWIENLD